MTEPKRICLECDKDISKRNRSALYCGGNCRTIYNYKKINADINETRWGMIGANSSLKAMMEIHQMFRG